MLKGTKYRLFCLLLLLVFSVTGLVYIILREQYNWLIFFIPILLLSVFRILKLFSDNVRKITFMFNSIASGDYSFQFTEYGGTLSDNLLNMTLNRIRDILVREKEEILQKEQYYSLILNSINTGILVINENGSIYQTNNEVLKLFGLPVLTHISQLSKIDESLPGMLRKIRAGDKHQVSFMNERGEVTLSLRSSEMEVKGNNLHIIAVNEIGSELAERETEAWIKLIRVLTHEIMNSITPITSLSETLMDLPGSENPDIRHGLETIRATGKGLTSFVDSYRQLTRIPTPHPVLFDVRPFLERAVKLARQEFPSVDMVFSVEPGDLILYADENLTFQVVMNLLKNAGQTLAGQSNGRVEITAGCPAGEQVIIQITDNGPGIPPDIIQHIFIPFFTTKEQGSGIGLSLSRQIMRLQGGTLTLQSSPLKTSFLLTFP